MIFVIYLVDDAKKQSQIPTLTQ